MNFMAMSGTVYGIKGANSAITSYFFNSASSFVGGSSLTASPVPGGYAATPFLSYGSYAQFGTDIAQGNIKYAYQWVMYDNEKSSATPTSEQQDPITSMQNFVALAHANNLKVILAPALSLAAVSGTKYPLQTGESESAWYTRVGIASAAPGDILLVQNEANEATLSTYGAFYASCVSQAPAGTQVWNEVSTSNGTEAQMLAAYNSVAAPGYFLAAPGDNTDATLFLAHVKAQLVASAPVVVSIVFNPTSPTPGQTVTATVTYSAGSSNQTDNVTATATDNVTSQTGTLSAPLTGVESDATTVALADGGTRTWTKTSDTGSVATFTTEW